MPLPNLKSPTHTLTIPSNSQEVQYRPFLVSEEKILLMAMEGNDQTEIVKALKQIISNCTNDTVDVSKLTLFDLEYIFLNLRAKSIGNEIELTAKIKCESPECPKQVPLTVDLNDVQVVENEHHTDKYMLNNEVGIALKYPSIDSVNKLQSTDMGIDEMFDIIVDSIDYIYDTENTYPASEQSRQELVDFLDSFTDEQFKKIMTFFDTMPRLEKEVEVTCPNCGRTETTKLSGLQSFFV